MVSISREPAMSSAVGMLVAWPNPVWLCNAGISVRTLFVTSNPRASTGYTATLAWSMAMAASFMGPA